MRRIRRSTQRKWITLAVFIGILALWGICQVTGILNRQDVYLPQTVAYAQEAAAPVAVHDTPTAIDSGVRFALSDIYWEGNIAYVNLPNNEKARLSLNRDIQTTIENSMKAHPVPHGGAVAIEPNTGRILAIVSASNDRPRVENYAAHALAPSASVFKLITAAALLEKGSVDTQARVCYSGGSSALSESDVRGNPATDNTCATLEQAIGHSINAVMARLAYQHLSKEDLEKIALKFAFNREIPTEFDTDVSQAEFVTDDIERAKSAAGFWHVNLSPMHGALIGAAIQNHGVMMTPIIIDEITNGSGQSVYRAKPRPWLVTMSASNADMLSKMAENTTREGTARKAFANRKGWRKNVRVAGKTGTLSNKRPYYTFNWFVGWGSDNKGRIAVGALVVNTGEWWIKGSDVAARAMGAYFRE